METTNIEILCTYSYYAHTSTLGTLQVCGNEAETKEKIKRWWAEFVKCVPGDEYEFLTFVKENWPDEINILPDKNTKQITVHWSKEVYA